MTTYIFENLGKKMWESLKRTFCPLVSEHMFLFFTSNIIINGLEIVFEVVHNEFMLEFTLE